MKVQQTKIDGVYIFEPKIIEDNRGFFAEVMGGENEMVQWNVAFNKKAGTLRGMHYQAEPYGENKLIRCITGAIYDVVLDLREGSNTLGEWVWIDLTAKNRRTIFIPKGCAHGYQTLGDNTEVFYAVSEYYNPESSRIVKYDDPKYGIKWPLEVTQISAKDKNGA